jgi:hypothetical protein
MAARSARPLNPVVVLQKMFKNKLKRASLDKMQKFL